MTAILVIYLIIQLHYGALHYKYLINVLGFKFILKYYTRALIVLYNMNHLINVYVLLIFTSLCINMVTRYSGINTYMYTTIYTTYE